MDDGIVVNSSLTIPGTEVEFKFSRSGGPGGQNVNKVSSRVQVEFDIQQSPSLTEPQRTRLLHRLAGRLEGDGVLRVTADDSRSQWQNRQIAITRLVDILSDALKVQKRRIPTRRTVGSNSRRLETKKQRGSLKRGRRGEE